MEDASRPKPEARNRVAPRSAPPAKSELAFLKWLVPLVVLSWIATYGIYYFLETRNAPPKRPGWVGAAGYRQTDGKLLTAEDLSENIGWELVGADPLPPEAVELHRRGRESAARGDSVAALKDFAEAEKLAPRWPAPLYEAARICLSKGAAEPAEELYARTLQLAPDGYFTAMTAIDCLRKEKQGKWARGLYQELVGLESMPDPDEKAKRLRGIVERAPAFAAAWSMLADTVNNDWERPEAVDKGLSADPDLESRGELQVNAALILVRGHHPGEAIKILAAMMQDSNATLGNRQRAKAALQIVIGNR